MTFEEYKKQVKDIERESQLKKQSLAIQYALSHSTVNRGDFVTDHIGTVKVESIKAYISTNGEPSCVYFGTCYTKTGKPFKSGEKRAAYQFNCL